MRVTERGDGWTRAGGEEGGRSVTEREEAWWCEEGHSCSGRTDGRTDVMGLGSGAGGRDAELDGGCS